MGKFILGAFLFSLLPIWKQGAVKEMNLWQFKNFVDSRYTQPYAGHIPYEQAVTEAQEAYHYYNG